MLMMHRQTEVEDGRKSKTDAGVRGVKLRAFTVRILVTGFLTTRTQHPKRFQEDFATTACAVATTTTTATAISICFPSTFFRN
jgi:hypothetical protein